MTLRAFPFVLVAASFGSSAVAGAPAYAIHKIMDTNGDGNLAMTIEAPKDWTTQDSITWNLNLRLNPMSYTVSSSSPDKKSWISYLSGLTFDFSNNGFGGTFGKMPPKRGTDFLVEDLKAIHPNTDVEIVERKDTEIPFPLKPGIPGAVAHAYRSYLTAKFSGENGTFEERLSADFYGYSQPMGRGYRGNWFVSGLTVANAPQGKLPEVEQVLTTMLASEKMTTTFLNRYRQVAQMLLDQTKAENQAVLNSRAHAIVVGDDGVRHGRAMDKDVFIMHEEIKGLRSHLFSSSIGN